ncbi:putative fasciclin-like arabinogalactan protein 20 [Jatropha curcas]|uniref:putative fasciclin-like arabinogalactan protein 20 n=1 Tax=Jatropha curcas TaxID=180498 RepID=UPI0009D74EA4|nr:putative fasciclin-like arabinogalactan protein 20 [Jatropha curcas]
MATKFLIFFTLLSFLSISSSLSTETILDAAATLSNSGFNSMALILEFGSQTLIPPTTSLTIFCPSDTAFTESGQPSLSLLRFHFSPQTFRFNTLKSLPPGTKIPTLFSNHSLIITSTPSCEDQVSLNGVKINESAIYSNGSFVIFGIHKFLDPDFEVSGLISGRPVSSLDCSVLDNNSDYSLKEAIRVLRSKEYSILAMFLDLQLGEFNDEMMVTIFAPVDEVMKGYIM